MAKVDRFQTIYSPAGVTVRAAGSQDRTFNPALWKRQVDNYNAQIDKAKEDLETWKGYLQKQDAGDPTAPRMSRDSLLRGIADMERRASEPRMTPETVTGDLNTLLTNNMLSDAGLSSEYYARQDAEVRRLREKEKSSGINAVMRTVVPAGIGIIGGSLLTAAIAPAAFAGASAAPSAMTGISTGNAASGGVLATIGEAFSVKSAISGALTSGMTSFASGGNLSDALKGAVLGGVTGGFGGAIADQIGITSAITKRAFTGALMGASGGLATGDLKGAAIGAGLGAAGGYIKAGGEVPGLGSLPQSLPADVYGPAAHGSGILGTLGEISGISATAQGAGIGFRDFLKPATEVVGTILSQKYTERSIQGATRAQEVELQAQAGAAEYNAKIAAANAEISRENAQLAEYQTNVALEKQDIQRRLRQGSIRAAAGASGISQGNATDVLKFSAAQEELDLLMIQYQGDINVRNILSQADSFDDTASLLLQGAASTRSSIPMIADAAKDTITGSRITSAARLLSSNANLIAGAF